jgi:hypothetical protein
VPSPLILLADVGDSPKSVKRAIIDAGKASKVPESGKLEPFASTLPPLWPSRCILAIAHEQRIRTPCAADLSRWILACDRAQVRFEIFNAHRGQLLALGRLRHGRTSFLSASKKNKPT